LACILAQPSLLQVEPGVTEPCQGPFESAAIAELLGMVRDALAVGRSDGPEVVRYLFTRCADRQDLRQWIATAALSIDRIAEPAAFLAAVQRGRQRYLANQSARSLRQRLQQALTAGDRPTADLLTKQLVQRRPELPLHSKPQSLTRLELKPQIKYHGDPGEEAQEPHQGQPQEWRHYTGPIQCGVA
jgi:hypothetical protein